MEKDFKNCLNLYVMKNMLEIFSNYYLKEIKQLDVQENLAVKYYLENIENTLKDIKKHLDNVITDIKYSKKQKKDTPFYFFELINNFQTSIKYIKSDEVTFHHIFHERKEAKIITLNEINFENETYIQQYLMDYLNNENTPVIEELIGIMYFTDLLIRSIFILIYLETLSRNQITNNKKQKEFTINIFTWIAYTFCKTVILNTEHTVKIIYYFKALLNYITFNKSQISKYKKSSQGKTIKELYEKFSSKLWEFTYDEKIELEEMLQVNVLQYVPNNKNINIKEYPYIFAFPFQVNIFLHYDKYLYRLFIGISILKYKLKENDNFLNFYIEKTLYSVSELPIFYNYHILDYSNYNFEITL